MGRRPTRQGNGQAIRAQLERSAGPTDWTRTAWSGWFNADLRNAELIGSFDDTDFRFSDLTGVTFHYTSLVGTNFRSADLCGADLSTATGYQKADFRGAMADSHTRFPPGFDPRASGIIRH